MLHHAITTLCFSSLFSHVQQELNPLLFLRRLVVGLKEWWLGEGVVVG
jgi:hypothetical protein